MLRVCYVCWRVNVLVVITSLQHTVFSPDKRWVHFPFLEGILNFSTLFSISVPQITSSRLFFTWRLWSSVLGIILVGFCCFGGCSSFCKQLLQGLVKIDYIFILMECALNLVVLDLFPVVGCLLQAYQLFLTAYQQASGRNLASKISLSVLGSNSQNLCWLSRFFLFVVFAYMGCCF